MHLYQQELFSVEIGVLAVIKMYAKIYLWPSKIYIVLLTHKIKEACDTTKKKKLKNTSTIKAANNAMYSALTLPTVSHSSSVFVIKLFTQITNL